MSNTIRILGVGQIIGAFTPFGFQHVKNPAFAGWRIMFTVLGSVTVLVGIATHLMIPDNPMKTKWLSSNEKAAVLQHVSINKTGISNMQLKLSQVLELLLNPQMYLLTVMLLLLSTTAGVATVSSATLLCNVGFSSKQAALLNAPSGVISIASTLQGGFGIRHKKLRWPCIPLFVSPAITGGALMSFVQNKGGVLAGVWLVNSTVATMPIIYQWVAANNASHTKRPLAMALTAGSFSVGNIIGPQTFQGRDAPQYIPTKITVLATLCAGAACTPILFAYYKYENARAAILPRKDLYLYARIKFFADIKFGIHTVDVVGSKLEKEKGQDQDQYIANVALEFNLKRGGINQLIRSNELGILSGGKTMVVGIDVMHPSAGSARGAPSIAGVVASIRIQESRKDMVTALMEMIVERLRMWQKKNANALPQR